MRDYNDEVVNFKKKNRHKRYSEKMKTPEVNFSPSAHLLERMAERGITENEIRRCIGAGKYTYNSKRKTFIFTQGDLRVVVSKTSGLIITAIRRPQREDLKQVA